MKIDFSKIVEGGKYTVETVNRIIWNYFWKKSFFQMN